MSRIKTNIIANILGRGWAVLSTVVFLPLYVKLIGVEAYGLVGIFASLQGVIAFTDMGLTATLNREMARLSSYDDAADEMGDTLWTIELIYALIILVVTATIYFSSGLLATQWINAKTLTVLTIRSSVELMSFTLAFQVAISLYQGGMIGLQRQVMLNSINVVSGVLKATTTLLVLWLVSPTIEAFFLCQLATNIFQVVWTRSALWRGVPKLSRRPRFSAEIIKQVWQYSVGMLGMTVTSSILLQADKVILSRMLTLEVFGYYSLAWTFAQTPISIMSNPVYQAVFPKLTQYVALQAQEDLASLYHRACQAVSVLVFPVTAVICFFSRESLFVWLGNMAIAAQASMLESVLIASACLTGVLIMPYALVLANGWTSLSLKMNCINILLLIPLLYVLVTRYGTIGAGISWFILNSIYMLFFMYFMHQRLLQNEKWNWYLFDILLPALGAIVPVAALWCLGLGESTRLGFVPKLGGAWFISTLSCVMMTKGVRAKIFESIELFYNKRQALSGKP